MNYNELQQFAEELTIFYCKKYQLQPINIKVKFLNSCGRARYRTRFISVPVWSFEQGGLDYFTGYVLHEIIHFIRHDIFADNSHGYYFRALERKLLKEWGLVPEEYKKAYYKKLLTTSGKVVWLYGTKEKREAAGMKPYNVK